MDVRISDAEKIYIINGCEDNHRTDGRSCTDFRYIVVETGVLSTTDGSARVRVGDTDLLIGAKLELTAVDDSSKERNRIQFSVDCSANATPQFVGRGGDAFAEEVATALYAAYDNDDVLPDISKLKISPNHLWKIYLDVVILSYGGSVVDAASIGAKAVLSDLRIAQLTVRPADENKSSVELPDTGDTFQLDVSRAPIIITVSKIGTANVVDCCIDEEVCVRSALWIAVCPPEGNASTDSCIIPFIRQTSCGSLERGSVDEMLDIATNVACRLHKSLEARLAEEERTPRPPPGASFLA